MALPSKQIEVLRERLVLFSQNKENIDAIREVIINMEIQSNNKETILDICSEADADPKSFASLLRCLQESTSIDAALEEWDKK